MFSPDTTVDSKEDSLDCTWDCSNDLCDVIEVDLKLELFEDFFCIEAKLQLRVFQLLYLAF